MNEAAEYYLESLQRKPTNVEARIKLKEVGQKSASNMASDFFRNYNTQQLEESLSSFERLKEFLSKTTALNVMLDYPKQYDEDYQKAIETYCTKNHNIAYNLVNQKKYTEATTYINNIKKYNPTFKTTQQLEIIAVCEPLYQNAVSYLENKNYSGAFNLLNTINSKSENYKDSKNLFELASAGRLKHFMILEPKGTKNQVEKLVEDALFNNFSQSLLNLLDNVVVINNTPFTNIPVLMSNNANEVDLIRAIKKSVGADYFYVYDIMDVKQSNVSADKQQGIAYEAYKVKKNDTLIVTEYRPLNYNYVKASSVYSYLFSFKLIDANTNQIISSQTKNFTSSDMVEYNEFVKQYNGNINNIYPNNPNLSMATGIKNTNNWRKLFSANKTLKSIEVLKSENQSKNVDFFMGTVKQNLK